MKRRLPHTTLHELLQTTTELSLSSRTLGPHAIVFCNCLAGSFMWEHLRARNSFSKLPIGCPATPPEGHYWTQASRPPLWSDVWDSRGLASADGIYLLIENGFEYCAWCVRVVAQYSQNPRCRAWGACDECVDRVKFSTSATIRQELAAWYRWRADRMKCGIYHSYGVGTGITRKEGQLSTRMNPVVHQFLLRRQPDRLCAYCQRRRSEHCEHVIAQHTGGHDVLENVVLACVQCNSEKGIKSGVEFLKSRRTRRRKVTDATFDMISEIETRYRSIYGEMTTAEIRDIQKPVLALLEKPSIGDVLRFRNLRFDFGLVRGVLVDGERVRVIGVAKELCDWTVRVQSLADSSKAVDVTPSHLVRD